MVSDVSKKKAAQKKAAAAAKRGGKSTVAAATTKATVNGSNSGADKVANGVEAMHISDRTCTGVLCSHPLSRDISGIDGSRVEKVMESVHIAANKNIIPDDVLVDVYESRPSIFEKVHSFSVNNKLYLLSKVNKTGGTAALAL